MTPHQIRRSDLATQVAPYFYVYITSTVRGVRVTALGAQRSTQPQLWPFQLYAICLEHFARNNSFLPDKKFCTSSRH